MDENPNSPGLFPSTKVVLFEGLPGAGKSTAAHHAMLAARASGLDVIWNYEEEREHPVALFRDKERC